MHGPFIPNQYISVMYLENSEQHNISGAGQLSAEAMLAEQCQVPRLTEAPKGSAGLGITVLVEYADQDSSREMDSSPCCVEHGSVAAEETGPLTYSNGDAERFEQDPANSGLFESDHNADNCRTAELSQPCDECAQLCECFKACKASELRANDSLTSKCNCCELCVELFQQCESFDSEPGEALMGYDTLNQCEMSNFVAENTDLAEDQYEPSDELYECSDSDPDTSARDSEPCETGASTPDPPYLVDLPDCSAEFSESESTHDCNGLEGCESCRLTEDVSSLFPYCDTPVHIYFDDGENACAASECYAEYDGAEEAAVVVASLDEVCEQDDSDMNAATELPQGSDKASEFGTEDECISDCSSLETKSFTTCPDGSIASDHCSDSSGESDKVVQEDLSDEQTQWESFEEDEQTQQIKTGERNEEKKEAPTSDIVIEDYFDFFDRADYCRHQLSQKQRYISCFDGGDIDDCLHLGQESRAKPECTFEEITGGESDVCLDAPEEARDGTSGESDSESEKGPEDWSIDVASSLEDDDCEECEGESSAPDYEDAASLSEGDLGDLCEKEEAEVYPSSGKDSMCAPCADDISVEGDAYEDDVCDESPAETSDDDEWPTSTDGEDEDKTFLECSEMEPYWLFQGSEDMPDVEEYYACEIRSIQSSSEPAPNEFIIEGQLHNQIIIPGKMDGDASGTEFETAGVYEQVTVTEMTGPAEDLSNCFIVEETIKELAPQPDEDDGSGGLRPPPGVIHSVVSERVGVERRDARTEDSWASEQGSDAEEEPSDHESSEPCECEYCIPPARQVLEDGDLLPEVPVKPLLPRMKSSDAGKICVVLDLDETLVHSSFKPVNNADFIIPVEIDGTVHQVYVLKRPHVDEFLRRMGELFECVLFTASLAKYADPVSDLLDKWGVFQSRLFRESCVFHKGNYVKDLSRLGRDLNRVIIIDNSPASYIFHPDNAVPVASWFDDMSDTELLDLIPFFESLSKADDIYAILKQQRLTS